MLQKYSGLLIVFLGCATRKVRICYTLDTVLSTGYFPPHNLPFVDGEGEEGRKEMLLAYLV